jgi:hypothetical protein
VTKAGAERGSWGTPHERFRASRWRDLQASDDRTRPSREQFAIRPNRPPNSVPAQHGPFTLSERFRFVTFGLLDVPHSRSQCGRRPREAPGCWRTSVGTSLAPTVALWVGDVRANRHPVDFGRNGAHGLPGCRTRGVRGCGYPWTLRRGPVGSSAGGDTPFGSLRRARTSGRPLRSTKPLAVGRIALHRPAATAMPVEEPKLRQCAVRGVDRQCGRERAGRHGHNVAGRTGRPPELTPLYGRAAPGAMLPGLATTGS